MRIKYLKDKKTHQILNVSYITNDTEGKLVASHRSETRSTKRPVNKVLSITPN